MRLGRVINLKGYNKFFSLLKENSILLIFIFIYLFGFGFGIFSLERFDGYNEFSNNCLNSFISSRSNDNFFGVALNSFLNYFNYIILVFIFGCCVFGVIVLPFVIFWCGLNYGSMIALLYSQQALKGIAFNTVVVLPAAVMFVTALILTAKDSVRFSIKLASITFPRTAPTNLSYEFRYYFFVFVKFTLVILFASLIDAFISCNFLGSLMF